MPIIERDFLKKVGQFAQKIGATPKEKQFLFESLGLIANPENYPERHLELVYKFTDGGLNLRTQIVLEKALADIGAYAYLSAHRGLETLTMSDLAQMDTQEFSMYAMSYLDDEQSAAKRLDQSIGNEQLCASVFNLLAAAEEETTRS